MDDFSSELALVGEGLSDDAPLWRYTRLSTVLNLLISGHGFIPTIDQLRKTSDPTEATQICRRTKERFENLTSDDTSMLQQFATADERTVVQAEPDSSQAKQIYFEIWSRELGKRRCIWCWHHAPGESKAMWDIYAGDGVAICTTPARMRRALKSYCIDSGILGKVYYSDCPEKEDAPELFLRPYFIKQTCYRHEEEVRLVLPSEPHDNYQGHKLRIDGRELIAEVRFSPRLPRDEALEFQKTLQTISTSKLELDWEKALSCFPSTVHSTTGPFLDRDICPLPRAFDIANFGFNKMPFLLSDDIRRDIIKRPEWQS